MNLVVHIEAHARRVGETVEHVVIGRRSGDERVPPRVHTWCEGRRLLDYDFDQAWAYQSHPFYAYTKSWVIFAVFNHDWGGVVVERVPRHPTPDSAVDRLIWGEGGYPSA